MSYLALYRRFRPTTFDKVIGQEHIIKTLINQIKTKTVGHAYLFCGVRGTGKTSIAKIFAKAVNCTDNVNGSPCGKCKACQSLQDVSNIDIVEIDAASNNKVENVREIRDNVQYSPVNVQYKVYIIDEVHMLTTEAFNALLKTLEEPPKHAIFILATTEPQKFPATILSRCMRFDFRLIADKEVAKLVASIYDEIGKEYTEEAVMAIARAGEGCVRDALSVADLCLSVGEGKITYEDVLTCLGASDVTKTDLLVQSIFNSDVGQVLSICDELISLGKSIANISKDLISYIRDVAICKSCKNAKEILALPTQKFESLQNTAKLANEHRVLRILEILSEEDSMLRYASKPRAVFETALIKATMPEIDYNIDALISRIAVLEKQLKSLTNGEIKVVSENHSQVETIVSKTTKTQETQIVKDSESEPIVQKNDEIQSGTDSGTAVETPVENPIETTTKPAQNQANSNVDGRKIWGVVVRKLRQLKNKIMLWVACQEMTATLVGNNLIVAVSGDSERALLEDQENRNIIQSIINEYGAYNLVIKSQSEVDEIVTKDNSQVVTEFFGKDKTIIK